MPQRFRTFGYGLVLIAGAALAVRLAFTLVVAPDVRPLPDPTDAGAYHLLANDLADGRGYIRPYDRVLVKTVRPTAEYPPLFPALLSVVSRAGGDTVGAQRRGDVLRRRGHGGADRPARPPGRGPGAWGWWRRGWPPGTRCSSRATPC